MRCEKCGRDIKNAELWRLATDPKAPTSWSMQQLCWECREHPERPSPDRAIPVQIESSDDSAWAPPDGNGTGV